MIFSLVYVGYRLLRGTAPASEPKEPPGSAALLVLAGVMGLASFLVHIRWPIGWTFRPLNLQFPFFPQYLCMFPLGIIASRNAWLTRIPRATGRRGLAAAALLIVVLFPILFTVGGALRGDMEKFLGGFFWQNFVHRNIEETISFYGHCSSFISVIFPEEEISKIST